LSNPEEIRLDVLRSVGYSAVVSDCCDAVGLRHQTLTPGIVPITSDAEVLIGLARPVFASGVRAAPARPYEAEITYIDSLGPDDVVVAVADQPVAFWGELFSTAARARGAVGGVIDGAIRDTARIRALGWPVFATSTRPTDSLGRLSIVHQDDPVTIRGVTVELGDLVVADADGVVVVPRSAMADVIKLALAKAATEGHARELLLQGSLLRDAWDRFGVL
jgi:4-hydroxy-4-methyl-2-oxoglutarate aldolase